MNAFSLCALILGGLLAVPGIAVPAQGQLEVSHGKERVSLNHRADDPYLYQIETSHDLPIDSCECRRLLR